MQQDISATVNLNIWPRTSPYPGAIVNDTAYSSTETLAERGHRKQFSDSIA